MGNVISTFFTDYNKHFSYKAPLDSLLDEEKFEYFPQILSQIDVEIIDVSSESESD